MKRYSGSAMALTSAMVTALLFGCGPAPEAQRAATPKPASSPKVQVTAPIKSPVPPAARTPMDLLPHSSPAAEELITSPTARSESAEPEEMPQRMPPAPFMGDTLTTDELKANLGKPGVMRLTWQTVSEKDNYGFVVMRGSSEDEKTFVPLNEKAPVLGAGNSSVPHAYEFYDKDVKIGENYYYFLNSVDIHGNIKKYSIIIKRQATHLYLKDRDTEASPTAAR